MAARRSLSPRPGCAEKQRERASGKLQFDAESLRGKEHRERVHCKVAAGRAETIGQPMAADIRACTMEWSAPSVTLTSFASAFSCSPKLAA